MSTAKPSIFSVLLGFKCPRCRKGNLYFKPFSIKTAFKMKDNCENCELKYTPEPGFYYGAMFISYIITAWVFIIIAGSTMYFLNFNVDQALITVVIFAAIFYVFFFRLGRAIWLAINVKYLPKSDESSKVE